MTQIDEEDGQIWMCTGDEAVMDEEGYVQSEHEVHIVRLPEWVRLTWVGICQQFSRRKTKGNLKVTSCGSYLWKADQSAV